MHQLARFHPQIKVAYTQIVTITTDSLLEINEFRQAVGAEWPFLSDVHRVVQKDLDIQEYTDPSDDPMIPYTFVLKPGLVVHTMYMGYWFWGRPQPWELARDLREATSEIRPDWRIDTPEMRARWERGDRSGFWPYGKRLVELFGRQEGMTEAEAHELAGTAVGPVTDAELYRRRREGHQHE